MAIVPSALVLAECDVECPIQAVLNEPQSRSAWASLRGVIIR